MSQELLSKYAARMKELGGKYDALKEQEKAVNAEYDELRLRLIPELMSEMNIRTVTYEGIGRIQLAADVYATIPTDHKQAAYNWLADNGFGDLVQPTVNASTLKAWCKEQLKGGTDLPEDLFRVTPFTRASIVKK